MRWQDWVRGPAAYAALGFGGARRWDVSPKISRAFVCLMVVLAIALLLQWQMIEKHDISPMLRHKFNISIWIGFLIDFVFPMYWVRNRWLYVRDNWMLVIILLVGSIFFWPNHQLGVHYNIVRPMLALYILIPSFSMILSFFVDGFLLTTLLAAGIIVVVFGLLVAGIDPNIHHAIDGFWWALATVSTVGYGDVVPSSMLGRLLGMLLIVIGIGVFVVLTANFLGLVLSRRSKQSGQDHRSSAEIEILEIMSDIVATQQEQNQVLRQMQSELKKLQK